MDHKKRIKCRSIFISDTHFGLAESQVELLHDFLKTYDSEYLYLVGDIIDFWKLSNGGKWEQKHNNIVRKILSMAKHKTKVIYVPGNHDEVVRQYVGSDFGNIQIKKHDIHTCADGKKYYVMHGDEVDLVVGKMRFLAVLGSEAYDLSITLSHWLNKLRGTFGLPYWSLSSYLKRHVKEAVNYIGNFEESVSKIAKENKVDGVICGHIHNPIIIKQKDIMYVNCGDWVESCTAVIENLDGSLELVDWSRKLTK